ncbi:hypothetical protein [Microbacterium sp. NC79]|uniref:hypothetical protein n=1 Tax=Microbacterium sp. NC79 TaxID=2851009 RepID=UPI001C2C7A57|nr:hypothetical protein [Microbacterium sp. NC79]MBV0895502.1 hypothetical protein [Microbacterium sp. NC79]
MLALLRTWGRVLVMHGPALGAAYLIGHTAHYILIWVSGIVGAYSSFALVLIAPLAVLSKLLAFVAMMLITRDALPTLNRFAPATERTVGARRAGFSEAVLSSVIPFFAFYYAAGFFREDLARILTISQNQVMVGAGSDIGNATQFDVSPALLILLVTCFVLKQAWEKFKNKLPIWTRVPAVYLDVVWVLVLIYGASSFTVAIEDWIASRAVVQWTNDFGDWFAVSIPAVAVAWEAIVQVVTVILNLSVVPLAWLLIAGVVFGEAIAVQRPKMERITRRYDRLNAAAKRRLRDTAGLASSRVKPILEAGTLLLHAGPIRIAFYLLLSQAWLFLDQTLAAGIPRLFGAHAWEWWVMFLPLISVIPALISEPIRIALIAAAYDGVLGTARNGGVQKTPAGSGTIAPGVENLVPFTRQRENSTSTG